MLIIDEQLFIIDEQLLIIDEQLLIIDEQLLIIDEQLLIIDEQLLIIDEQLLIIDEWLLHQNLVHTSYEPIHALIECVIPRTQCTNIPTGLDTKTDQTKQKIISLLDDNLKCGYEYQLLYWIYK